MSLSALMILATALSSLAATPVTEPETDEYEVEAVAFSKGSGVSLEEARRRIEAGSDIDFHIQALRQRYQSRLTFISIEQHPDQHIVVGLQGPAMEPTRRVGSGEKSIRVEFEEGYPYTDSEFGDLMKRASARAMELIPDVTGVGGRPELGAISIHVEGASSEPYNKAVKDLEKEFGLTVELALGRARERNSE